MYLLSPARGGTVNSETTGSKHQRRAKAPGRKTVLQNSRGNEDAINVEAGRKIGSNGESNLQKKSNYWQHQVKDMNFSPQNHDYFS